MKRLGLLVVLAIALAGVGSMFTRVEAVPPPPDHLNCATIQDGTIIDSAGNPIQVGSDQFGYNYQAHLFVGTYDSLDRVLGDDVGSDPYPGDASDPPMATFDDQLIMKWSDAWLANVDCDGDRKLDRGLVDGEVGGTSLGWLTNQSEGDYDSDGDGTQDAHYSYFVKIVWIGAGGSLWGEYQIVEQVLNDPVGGLHGLLLPPVAPPGFGLNDQWTTN